MNKHRRDVKKVIVIFGDNHTQEIWLHHGWMTMADNSIKNERGGVGEEFISLTLGGRVDQRHDDAPIESDPPKSIPENDEVAHDVDARLDQE